MARRVARSSSLQIAGRPAISVLAAGVLAAAIPFGWHILAKQIETQTPGQEPLLRLESLATLEQDRVAKSGIRPRFPGARAVDQTTYLYNGGPVDLYIAYYRNQRQGAELISVLNNLEPTERIGVGQRRRVCGVQTRIAGGKA